MQVAREIMSKLNAMNIHDKAAIVYDIDGTLVTNDGRPIVPIIKTFQYAKSLGLLTVIITARPGTVQNIEFTRKLLKKYGIEKIPLMYFLPPDNVGSKEQTDYKLKARESVTKMGYKIVMSVGDQPWDIGKYGGDGVIVPPQN